MVAPHFEPPAKQPSELKRGWTAKVGDGYGTTAVSGDRLYVHARQKSDEVVWCLDLNDGKPKCAIATPNRSRRAAAASPR